jgi:predicted HicB family RNase H-like nuclease
METQTAEKATLTIDREVWKQAKATAALQDRTLADFVEEAIREAIKKARTK